MSKNTLTYILSEKGQPLMPTDNHGKVAWLLKQGKAKVVQKEPFVIRLLFPTKDYTRHLTLGVDLNTYKTGLAVIDTETKEVLYLEEVYHRTDIKQKLTRRRDFRSLRRYRKTRYRKHKGEKKRKTKVSPSVMSKINRNIKAIEDIKKILPISEVVIKSHTFDTKLTLNENNKREYKENIKLMVKKRDKHTCLYCKRKSYTKKDNATIIVKKIKEDEQSIDSYITVCDKCANRIEKREIKPPTVKKKKVYSSIQLSLIRTAILRMYPQNTKMYTYQIKAKRIQYNLPQRACIDASLVATNGEKPVYKTNVCIVTRGISKGDYKQTQGKRVKKNVAIKKMYGFRRFDKVNYLGVTGFIKGRMNNGYAILMDIHYNNIYFENIPKGKIPKMTHFKLVSRRKSYIRTKETILEI